MTRGVRPAIVLWLLLASPLHAQQPGDRRLTVDEAVRLAVANNRQIQVAALEVDKARADQAALRTRKRPAFQVNVVTSELLTPVNFVFPEGIFGVYPSIGPVPARETELSTPQRPNTFVYATAGQPLTQLRRIGYGIEASEAGVSIAREQLRERTQAVAAEVRRACFALAQTRAAIAAADLAVTTYRELDRTTSEYVAQQTVLKAEALDVKARLARALYTVAQLRNALASQTEQLNVLLGRDLAATVDVADLTIPEASSAADVTLAAARANALANRPEVRQARLKIDQADLDRRAKRSEFVPDVSLSFTYLSPFNIEFLPKNIAALGVSGTWEPFDWGRKSRELAAKMTVVSQARLALSDIDAQVQADVGRRWRAFDEARLLIAAGRAALDAAEERLRVAKDRFGNDAALLKDVLQAQAALADADQAYQQGLAAFWTAWSDLQRATGEDLQ
jgi:outer membrane protein